MSYTILFGLSANPPTGDGGHAGIVRWAATKDRFEELDGPVDQVWVLPVYIHAFEEKRSMPSFEHRLRMAELNFDGLEGVEEGKVRVLPTERDVYQEQPGERVGTIDVVRALTATHPDRRFALLLGEDTYEDLSAGKWKESEALLSMVKVVVVPRVGVEAGVDRTDGPALTDVSSTAVRNSADLSFLKRVLRKAVMEYIRTHRLYAFGDRVGPR